MANSPATCPACGGVPETPLCCEACGHLLDLPEGAGPFEVFGLEPAFLLDATALRKRMLALSRALHPDFHARAGADTRRRAEDGTAALNAAYRVLVDDLRRADWIVAALGGPGEDQDRSMPTAFLQSVLEWNEAIEAARGTEEGSPERAALLPLARELAAARAEHVGAVAARLTPLPPRGSPLLAEVRKLLNALRYLDRSLQSLRDFGVASR